MNAGDSVGNEAENRGYLGFIGGVAPRQCRARVLL